MCVKNVWKHSCPQDSFPYKVRIASIQNGRPHMGYCSLLVRTWLKAKWENRRGCWENQFITLAPYSSFKKWLKYLRQSPWPNQLSFSSEAAPYAFRITLREGLLNMVLKGRNDRSLHPFWFCCEKKAKQVLQYKRLTGLRLTIFQSTNQTWDLEHCGQQQKKNST